MMNVECEGSEENLDLCSFEWTPEGVTNHSMDAVVECYGGSPTGSASTPEECNVNTLQELLTLARSNLDMAREDLSAERNIRISTMHQLQNNISALRLSTMQSISDLETERNERVTSVAELQRKVQVLEDFNKNSKSRTRSIIVRVLKLLKCCIESFYRNNPFDLSTLKLSPN